MIGWYECIDLSECSKWIQVCLHTAENLKSKILSLSHLSYAERCFPVLRYLDMLGLWIKAGYVVILKASLRNVNSLKWTGWKVLWNSKKEKLCYCVNQSKIVIEYRNIFRFFEWIYICCYWTTIFQCRFITFKLS